LDGNGGVRVAWVWRLHGNFWDFLGFFGRVIGAPCDTPWVCCAAVWFGSGANVPVGYACLFDGNGGMRGRSPGQIYHRGMPGFFDSNGGVQSAGA